MVDIKYIRASPAEVQEICVRRGVNVDIESLLEIDSRRTSLEHRVNDLRSRANKLASTNRYAREEERAKLTEEGAQLKKDLKAAEEQLALVNESYQKSLLAVPNLLAADTPDGKDSSNNVELTVVGIPPQYDFPAKD